jgi:tetratricopeptide (TPR) repeat protein
MVDAERQAPEKSFRAVALDELERIEVAGVVYHPIRRALGIETFGCNAYTGEQAGDQLIERHDECSSGAGRHEELYLVVSGRARFTVADEEIDAPTGTLVFVPDLAATREAVAEEPRTTVVVIGAPADRRLPVSPFEFWFTAEPAYRAGDYDQAIAIASKGLDVWPEHGSLHYQLACYHSLAGNHDRALDHLETAVANEPRARAWAEGDADLDAVRADPRFPAG